MLRMPKDPLHYWPLNKWKELQDVFKSDWPRGIPGYTSLEHQREWLERGIDYGFKVYCPFGDVWNGMVAINEKNTAYEIVVQCPRNDTEKLEEALKKTTLIDWRKPITIPFAPTNILKAIKRILQELCLETTIILPSASFYLDIDKNTALYDVNLPPEVTFDLLTEDHIDLVDSKWPHRYPGSTWYFELLIKTKSGYGLFHNGDLISWMLINEFGILTHVYTLEEHRKKGFAEMLLKLICNIRLKGQKYTFVFCVDTNTSARNLYTKVGLTLYDAGIKWIFLENKSSQG